MKKYLAEFIGTFSLVFFGTGAAITDEVMRGSVSHVGVAVSFGLVVMVLVYAIGDISGAHLNPAVTLAFACNGNLEWKQVIPYGGSQLLGAMLGSIVLRVLFPTSLWLGATLPSGGWRQSFLLETLLSFFLMFVILRVATGSREQGLFAGLAVGSVVLLEAMFAGPVSGASMNPARSLAPALVGGHLQQLWIYLTAPFIGAVAAVLPHRFFKK